MRVLVCGSRHFNNYELLKRTLSAYNITEIIHGLHAAQIHFPEDMAKKLESLLEPSQLIGSNLVKEQDLLGMLKCSEKDNQIWFVRLEDQTVEEPKI